MANFSTRAGQERLGHELSHVMSQRSGQVRGSGFLSNASLEARADREGAMAAAGQQVYSGPVTHALSGAAPSALAAEAMQAKKASTQASEDADKLYAIQNAKQVRGKGFNSNQFYYEGMTKNPTPELMREILKRRDKAGKNLIKHRDRIKENFTGQEITEDQYDYEANLSAAGEDYELYNNIFNDMGLSTRMEKELNNASKGTRTMRIQADTISKHSIHSEDLNNDILYYSLFSKDRAWSKEARKRREQLYNQGKEKYNLN